MAFSSVGKAGEGCAEISAARSLSRSTIWASRAARASASRASCSVWTLCLVGLPPVSTSSTPRPRRSSAAAVSVSTAASDAMRRQPWRGRLTHLPRALSRSAISSALSLVSSTLRPTVRSNQSCSESGDSITLSSTRALRGASSKVASSGESSTVISGESLACQSRKSSAKPSLTGRIQASAQPSHMKRNPEKLALAILAEDRSNCRAGSPTTRGGGPASLRQRQPMASLVHCCAQRGLIDSAVS